MKPTIVIVGGGAGGLELASQLGRQLGRSQLADIVLVDRNPTHLWKPRLHEVATGVLNAGTDELSYAAQARKCGFRFILGTMHGIDRENRQLRLAHFDLTEGEGLPERQLDYDYLVIAVGSRSNDFGTPGAREHCIFLDCRESAERFHRRFLQTHLLASQGGEKTGSFNIAIVGAGATGVELAAEIHHSAQELSLYGFDGIRPEEVNISLIEAADRVMPALSEKASAAIQRQLQQLGIHVLTGKRVESIDSEHLHTSDGLHIAASLKVWSAGIKAPEFLGQLDGLESNHIHQLLVGPTLQTSKDPQVFAFGDCACYTPEGASRPVPPRAQVASQQAKHLLKTFRHIIRKEALPEFRFRDKGSLISMSKNSSVGSIMGNLSRDFTFEGKLARWMYLSLYRMHQVALHGRFGTLLLILRDLLNRNTGPRVKLH